MITCVRVGAREFELGDVVRLKSGGPPMTITGFTTSDWPIAGGHPIAICQWVVTRKHAITGADEHVIACRAFDARILTKEPRDQVL